MATYRSFYIGFWDDDDILELNADERYVYVYLITHPKGTMCGVFELSMKLAEFHLKIPAVRVLKAIEGLQKYGKIVYDQSTKEVCIINWVRHNYIDSPNTRKSLEASIKAVKNPSLCDSIRGLPGAVKTLVSGLKPSVRDSTNDIVKDIVLEPLMPFETKEPKKEKVLDIYEPLISEWNLIMNGKAIPQVRIPISDSRKKHFIKCVDDNGIDAFREMMNKVSKSNFCTGITSNWSASFDWCIIQTNFTKIVEGNYDNLNGGTAKPFERQQENKNDIKPGERVHGRVL
ncbi:MAG: hypothetical protein WC325_12580 [Candidatus Bathyarchaeia archaeon]|jgi:hypothetical protein